MSSLAIVYANANNNKNTEVKRNRKWHDERLARSRKSIVALSSAVEKERNQNARIQCLRLHVFLFFFVVVVVIRDLQVHFVSPPAPV